MFVVLSGLYAFYNCPSIRDARFHHRSTKQSFYDTLGARLGIRPGDIVVIGSGYCGTNSLGMRGSMGAGGAKVCRTCGCRIYSGFTGVTGVTSLSVTVLSRCCLCACLQAAIIAQSRYCRCVYVNEYLTSQRCSVCAITGHSMEECATRRTVSCTNPACTLINRPVCRDQNSAQNLTRAFFQ